MADTQADYKWPFKYPHARLDLRNKNTNKCTYKACHRQQAGRGELLGVKG